MLFHDAVADAETQTGSLAHTLGSVERVEDALRILGSARGRPQQDCVMSNEIEVDGRITSWLEADVPTRLPDRYSQSRPN